MMAQSLPPRGEGGPAGPDEGKLCHGNSFAGSNGTPAPHQSAGGAADSFPQGGSPACRKRCAHPLAPSARGLRPQAVGERTVRLPEIFRAMARFSPSAPSGHLPRRGRFFDILSFPQEESHTNQKPTALCQDCRFTFIPPRSRRLPARG